MYAYFSSLFKNIAKIISDTTQKPIEDVEEKMHNRTTLDPTQAKEFGLATGISSVLYDEGNILYSVYEDGSIFEYIPNPAVTANTTQFPINFYNMPPQNN